MILIIYTTKYKNGSDKFELAANTLLRKIKKYYDSEIVCSGIVSKKDLLNIFLSITDKGQLIEEYHFIGHSGMYGPMYGTVEFPEQFSPYELKTLNIPFSPDAKAYFHCCRSARWFAPFFAEQFKVETFGYYWYTSFSSDFKKYKRITNNSHEVYAAGCIGKKSHGLLGSLRKHSGLLDLESMKSFKPGKQIAYSGYDHVADLYDKVFNDIKVRKDEWEWICRHFPFEKDITVVDIGCGNGALLKEIAPKIKKGIGIDTSEKILKKAVELNKFSDNLSFHLVDRPFIPCADNSADLIISLLSFRYMDWDPIMMEIKRVLKPEGKLLIIDMVTVPVKLKELPAFIRSKLSQYRQRFTHKSFYMDLRKLVSNPNWKEMLKHNPIRAEHEMKWYLESRFPGQKVKKINVGWHSCILAFDSGNIRSIKDIKLTYP
ncbi:hypothetical protein BH10BAC5_BH10BAC5_28540 [soil metagenome]